MKFFDIMKDILMKGNGKLHEAEGFNTFSPFMLCRYLSMRNDLIAYADILNRYHANMTNEQVYLWAYNTIPKQKSGYIRYIKKPTKKKKKVEEVIDTSYVMLL